MVYDLNCFFPAVYSHLSRKLDEAQETMDAVNDKVRAYGETNEPQT